VNLLLGLPLIAVVWGVLLPLLLLVAVAKTGRYLAVAALVLS